MLHERGQRAPSDDEACLMFYRRSIEQRYRQTIRSPDLALLARPLPGLPWYFYVLIAIGLGVLAIVRYRSARVLRNERRAVDAIARL
jgi:hypothetical protein